MQQPDSLSQLAQSITNFLEPLVPYLIIGTEKAAEEAGKKAGSDVWNKGKNLWKKFCYKDNPKLKEAAGNMVFLPTDAAVKQAFKLEILKSLEQDLDLAKEVATIMEVGVAQRIIAKNNSTVENVKQKSTGTKKVSQEIIADGSTIKGVEQTHNAR